MKYFVVFYLAAALTAAVLFLVSCSFLDNIASEPGAMDELGNAASEVLAAPSNPFGWVRLVGALAGVLILGIGGRAVYDKRKKAGASPSGQPSSSV